jgi:hypothetical protein
VNTKTLPSGLHVPVHYIERPREKHMLEFFAYETVGGAIGNINALLRADFGEAVRTFTSEEVPVDEW